MHFRYYLVRGELTPGDTWQCLETFLAALTGGGGGATGISRVEAWEAAKHPTVPRTAPQQRSIWAEMSVELFPF